MYIAELEKEKREKIEQKIVRLNKIVDSFFKGGIKWTIDY